jgi:hypothetical protein
MCNKDPIEFWEYSPAESTLMVEGAFENFKLQRRQRAELYAVMGNMQGGKKDGTAFRVEDFCSEEEKTPESMDSYKAGWEALIANCKNGAV